MNTITALLALAAVTTVAGCTINRAAYATNPVEVLTPQGIVTCQLYSKGTTIWDEAVAAPPNLSLTAAHNICKREGLEQKHLNEKHRYTPAPELT